MENHAFSRLSSTLQAGKPDSDLDLDPDSSSELPQDKATQIFKLDDYEEVSKIWSAELPDYTLIAKLTEDAASNWKSEEYCDKLRRASQPQQQQQNQSFKMLSLFLPSFFNGPPPDPPVNPLKPLFVSKNTKDQRPPRVSALEYITTTGAEAIRNGNKDLVFGPLHPKQRYQETLKFPRKSGYTSNSDSDFSCQDYLATQPLSYLPALPEYW